MPKLNITQNPCVACGERRTIGVAYGEGPNGEPPETKWWCATHLPEEYKGVNFRPAPDDDRWQGWEAGQ